MKPIKAFTPYNLKSNAFHAWCAKAAKSSKTATVLQFFLSKDPASHAWGNLGLSAPIDDGIFVHDLDGAAYLLCYCFNERILPGAVRDEKLLARINEIVEKEGREVTKKEYAQTRDEVEAELLPQAFIRRSYVPILVYPERILICTTSAKKCESIIANLQAIMTVRKIDCEIWNIWTENDIAATLKTAVLEGAVDTEEGYLVPADAAVFKGADKRCMRIKDRDVSNDEIQSALLDGSYAVTELRFLWQDEAEQTMAEFTITDKLIIKGIKMAETVEMKSAEDAHATTFIYAKQFKRMLGEMIEALGGESDTPPSTEPEDEEL